MYPVMKIARLFTLLSLTLCLLLVSCNKDGEFGGTIKFRRANIAGSNMLALAQGGGEATKAEGDVTIGPIPQNYGLVEWNGAYIRIS